MGKQFFGFQGEISEIFVVGKNSGGTQEIHLEIIAATKAIFPLHPNATLPRNLGRMAHVQKISQCRSQRHHLHSNFESPQVRSREGTHSSRFETRQHFPAQKATD